MKTSMRLLLVLAMVVTVAGCKVGEGAEQVATACASASAAIKVLTVANQAGKLSVEQQRYVVQTIGVIDPVCSRKTQPSLSDVQREAFLQAVTYLQEASQ
mgnify:CR=1 FL=1